MGNATVLYFPFREQTPETSDEGDTLFNPPICFPRQMEIGQTFSTDTTVISPDGNQTPKTFVLKLVGKEQVTTPAGTFTDSLHSQAGWSDEGPLNESYEGSPQNSENKARQIP